MNRMVKGCIMDTGSDTLKHTGRKTEKRSATKTSDVDSYTAANELPPSSKKTKGVRAEPRELHFVLQLCISLLTTYGMCL